MSVYSSSNSRNSGNDSSNPYKPDQLAIDGGKPVRSSPWPTYDKGNVIIDDQDIRRVVEVLESKRLFRYDRRPYEETAVGKFENLLRAYFGVKHVLAVNSGTSAIALPLMAMNLPSGALVGCPTFSFTATPSAIIQARLNPILIEVDQNLHMDLNDLEKKIVKLSALVVVHMRGFPAPLERILEIAAKHSVPVIEDAVPVLGLRVKSRPLGTFGIAGAFSTQSDKSLNTGEGGFIVTNDDEIYKRCVVLSGAYENLSEKHFSTQKTTFDCLALPVFNYRMDEIRGALGCSQLQKLDSRLDVLRKNYNKVTQSISKLKYLRCREGYLPKIEPIGDTLQIEIKGASTEECCWFSKALTAEGIETKALGDPIKTNVRRFWDWRYLFGQHTNSEIEQMFEQSFKNISSFIDIPMSATLTEADVLDCIRALKKVHEAYASTK